MNAARRVFSVLAPSSLREDLLSALEEGYEERLRSRGRAAATLWCGRQVLSLDWLRLRLELKTRNPRARRDQEDSMHSLVQDVRYAFRSLVRSPGFTLVVVSTLALGIGINLALMSVVRSVLLRPLPYGGEERVVDLWSQWRGFPKTWVSLPEYRFYRDGLESFEEVALYDSSSANLTDGEEPERVGVARVTTNLFQVLGVEPTSGRTFTAEEAQLETPDSVLLSHRIWQRRHGSDPGLVGRRIEIDGSPITVLGVLPEGFQLPIDFSAETVTDLYLPAHVPEGMEPIPQQGGSHGFFAVARLRDGVSLEEARAEVLAFNQRATADGIYPQEWRFRTLVIPVVDDVVGDVRPALFVLLGAVAFVLLIACTNVGSVVLARGRARRREIALRSSLGAGSLRLFRQLMTESLVLSALGGILAVLLAHGALRALIALEPGSVPRLAEARLDGAMILFATLLTMLTAVLFGLFPAYAASRAGLREALAEGSRGSSSGKAAQRFRLALVGMQLALAVVLLVGAGLMIRTFANLLAIDPGFRPEGVLTMRLSTPAPLYEEPHEIISFYDRLLEEVRDLPGVEHAGAVRILPLATQIGDWGTEIEGYLAPDGDSQVPADWQVSSAGYLEAMGIPLLEGRTFTDADRADSEQVVIVNRAFVERYCPDGRALGKRVRIGGPGDPPRARIVGVVGNVRHNGITSEIKAKWYRPLSQFHRSTGFTPASMTLTIASSLPPESLAPSVRAIVRRMDPKLPVAEVRTLEEILARSVAPSRFTMALLVAFSGLALLLAAVGIYGVVSHVVSQRTPEIGIRMALGASRASVLGIVGRQIGTVTLAGIAAGSAVALLAASSMTAVLHQVAPTDPLTFAAVPLILFATALAGSVIPALKATRVNPVTTLRAE